MTEQTEQTERREGRWEEACRAWNGAADDVDGAVARYRAPELGAGPQRAVLRRQAWAACTRARTALTGLENALAADLVDDVDEAQEREDVEAG